MQRTVRTMPVVMIDVLPQHCSEVAGSDDQEVVEAFAAQGADEAFRDRIRPGCPDRGGQIQAVEAYVSTSSVNNSEGFFQL
jgi:hypothetical protein